MNTKSVVRGNNIFLRVGIFAARKKAVGYSA